MRGALLSVAAFFLAAVPLGLAPAAAFAAPTCLGKPATHVMQPGEGTFHGGPGNDVVVGSSVSDNVELDEGGFDVVCGNGGVDFLEVYGPGSIADGGPGNDWISAYYGSTGRGGSGADTIQATQANGRAEGGSGSDTLFTENGGVADGGSGDDTLLGFSAGALYGGSGSDFVRGYDETVLIDCGAAYDRYFADAGVEVRRCEDVIQS
jgi:Ca2+-binding RTX toxin-like protein